MSHPPWYELPSSTRRWMLPAHCDKPCRARTLLRRWFQPEGRKNFAFAMFHLRHFGCLHVDEHEVTPRRLLPQAARPKWQPALHAGPSWTASDRPAPCIDKWLNSTCKLGRCCNTWVHSDLHWYKDLHSTSTLPLPWWCWLQSQAYLGKDIWPSLPTAGMKRSAAQDVKQQKFGNRSRLAQAVTRGVQSGLLNPAAPSLDSDLNTRQSICECLCNDGQWPMPRKLLEEVPGPDILAQIRLISNAFVLCRVIASLIGVWLRRCGASPLLLCYVPLSRCGTVWCMMTSCPHAGLVWWYSECQVPERVTRQACNEAFRLRQPKAQLPPIQSSGSRRVEEHDAKDSFRTVCGFFNVPHHYRLWDGTYVYRPYSRRLESLTICKCYSWQRQHFIFSYLKTLSVGTVEDLNVTHDIPHGSPVLYQLS